MMENLEVMLSIAATGVGLAITTVTFLSKFIKSARAKKIAENLVKMGNAILPYIEQAEKFVSFTGEEKKAYVMTKANQFAIDNGIQFEKDETGKKIDEIVALCKAVNVNKTSVTESGKSDAEESTGKAEAIYSLTSGNPARQKTYIAK